MKKKYILMIGIACIFILTSLFLIGCSDDGEEGEVRRPPRGPRGPQDRPDIPDTPDVVDTDEIIPVESGDWVQVTDDAFGNSDLTTVPEMEVFENYLYVATAAKEGGQIATLWRSASGTSWEEITEFSPDSLASSIHSFGVTDLGGGYIWLGTGSGFGAMIYRSQDGETWTGITDPGFGNSELTGAAPHMVVFKDYLYAGAGSHGKGTPGQVWRIPYTSTDPKDWEQLVDFADSNENVQTITYFYVWDDTLYFGTDAGGQLWESTDGVTFSQNTYVGTGFGDPTNYVLSSFVVFDDYFYVTTTNKYGGQLWRSNDGMTWEQITDNAFGKGNAVNELRSLRVSFGKIWLTAYTQLDYSYGTPIWVSDDGEHFTQYNEDGFGDDNNNGQNAVTIGFGDYQYFGGPNYVDGGQVWRVKVE